MYTVDTYITIQTALCAKGRELLKLWVASNGNLANMNFWAERIQLINDAKDWNTSHHFE